VKQVENNDVPLCVDMDGSLIATDLLFECLVRALKKNIFIAFLVPFWVLRGPHVLKYELARRSQIDIPLLPYRPHVVQWLREQKQSGRRLILCTGSTDGHANAVAEHLDLFSEVMSTTHDKNLTGKNKAALLLARFGNRGFDYVGNEHKDLHIWQHARHAVIVSNSDALVESAKKVTEVEQRFQFGPTTLKVALKAMRIHQWMKNLLVIVPLVTAHKMFDSEAALNTALAFLAFGLIASGTYIINDLFDLDSDRGHHKKSARAFASGAMSIKHGLLLSMALIVTSFLITLKLPLLFLAVLIIYFVVTLAYSFKLKSIRSLDVIVLASLYTVRVIAGTAAIDVTLSFWLLSFSMFLFLSLAIVKRVSELLNMIAQNKEKAAGRGYVTADVQVMNSLGTSSGYLAVLVFALYINSPEVARLYARPEILWLLCPVIGYWLTRVWLITGRGEMDEDPITFAIKDQGSWAVGAVAGIIIAAATLLN